MTSIVIVEYIYFILQKRFSAIVQNIVSCTEFFAIEHYDCYTASIVVSLKFLVLSVSASIVRDFNASVLYEF